MPVVTSYPGIYIEEIQSGVHTISGVATSIAAFVGWSPKGSTDKAGLVLSWMDFDRKYGGLDARSVLGYSVSHFFANGGQKAYIIRLVASDAQKASLTLDNVLEIEAKNEGNWANNYRVAIKARSDDPAQSDRFRLSVVIPDSSGKDEIVVESFENLSMKANDRRLVEVVVNNESSIINAKVVGSDSTPPNNTPEKASPQLSNGNDGKILVPNDSDFENAIGLTGSTRGINLLDRVDIFNILCVPGEGSYAILSGLEKFCRDHRAFLIIDSNEGDSFNSLQKGPNSQIAGGDNSSNAAFYHPWIKAPDPLKDNRPRNFPPSGFVAGVYSRTDINRGVWKGPAGIEASLTGIIGVTESLTDLENGILNLQAINCIRDFQIYGTVVWGARTLQGNQERGSEWKYIPVRRMVLFLEETLYRNLKWVVFEPNDEPLWSQIRLNVGAFMHNLFRQGAFQGKTPKEAYLVKCDSETTTQNDIDLGIVNILVAFAPLKPAEFVVIKIQQKAGQVQT